MLKTTSAKVIGERLRTRRESRGWRQEDVARLMREDGLHPWERVTVAGVESGARNLSPTELAALCGVFRRGLPQLLTLDEGETHLWLGGDFWLPEEIAVETGKAVWVRWSVFIEALADGASLHAGGIGGPSPEARAQAAAAMAAAPDETDRKAAKALGAHAEDVRRASVQLWGRSLAEERDRLLGEEAEPGEPARTIQARRGHITRRLTAMLRGFISTYREPGGEG